MEYKNHTWIDVVKIAQDNWSDTLTVKQLKQVMKRLMRTFEAAQDYLLGWDGDVQGVTISVPGATPLHIEIYSDASVAIYNMYGGEIVASMECRLKELPVVLHMYELLVLQRSSDESVLFED